MRNDRTHAVQIPRRCLRPSVYRALRRVRFSRRDCLRILWHGGEMSLMVATEAIDTMGN